MNRLRFLCLHGRGTDAEIFKSQTAKIRAGMDEDFEFVFLNGSVKARLPLPDMSMDTEFREERLGFWPHQSGDEGQFRHTYEALRRFIQKQGPFFGLFAFSEGASMAATVLIEDARRHGGSLGIRCGIFFCAVPPLDLNLDLNEGVSIRKLEPTLNEVLVHIPTAHIWSEGGDLFPGMGRELMALCDESLREEVVHNLGHDVPGSRSNECLRETIRAIERTIEKAKS